jgi:hypothetical protein
LTSHQWATFLLCMLAAAVQLYLPLIIGVPANLSAWAIGLSVLIGGSLAVIVLLALGAAIQPWLRRQLSKTEKRKKAVARAQRLSEAHGAFGVGFIAPFLIGLLLAAGIGITLDLPKKKLGFYLVLVVIVWAIGLAVLAAAMYQGAVPPPAS